MRRVIPNRGQALEHIMGTVPPRRELTRLAPCAGICVGLVLLVLIQLAIQPPPAAAQQATSTLPPRPTVGTVMPPRPTMGPTLPPRPTLEPTLPARPTLPAAGPTGEPTSSPGDGATPTAAATPLFLPVTGGASPVQTAWQGLALILAAILVGARITQMAGH